ncbi:MAG: type II secretion system protein [Phycisphaerae bacterium]
MQRRNGFTLVEVLIVVAIAALLVSMLVPSLSEARRQARLIQCASQMHSIHTALWAYAANNNRRLPPFAFSDNLGDLPLSGHWGGSGTEGSFARIGVRSVNLRALAELDMLPARVLTCPADENDTDDRFDSYCLRFPASEDIFSQSPALAWRGGRLLGVYGYAGGGQRIRVGSDYQRVPQVRTDRTYRPAPGLDGRAFAPASGAVLTDGFWGERAVDHGRRRNTCYGDGSVRSMDGLPVPAAPPGGVCNGGRKLHYADLVEPLWGAMDAAK